MHPSGEDCSSGAVFSETLPHSWRTVTSRDGSGGFRRGGMDMLVRECLRKAPVTVPPQCTLREAAALMQAQGVGALLVARSEASSSGS